MMCKITLTEAERSTVVNALYTAKEEYEDAAKCTTDRISDQFKKQVEDTKKLIKKFEYNE